MTKKSFARMQRDEFRKEAANRMADLNDLDDQYQGILQQHYSVIAVFQRKDILNNLEDYDLVEKQLRILERDIETMKGKLEDLKTRAKDIDHKFKTECSNPMIEEYSGLIFSYEEWMDEHQQLIMPTVTVLLEEISKAERKMGLQTQAARAQAGVNSEITAEDQAEILNSLTQPAEAQ
jgi:hypothetical protein